MEKIYENQNSNKKHKRHKQMKISGKTALSFAIALIAVFGLMAVGVTGISYAYPNTPHEYDDSILVKSKSPTFYMGDDNYSIISAYVDGTNAPIFCIDRATGFITNTNYTKEAEIEDKGLYYILSYVDTKDATVDTKGATWDFSNIDIEKDATNGDSFTVDDIKYWFGQAAIYNYLARKPGATPIQDSLELSSYKKVTTDSDIEDVENSDLSNSKHFAKKTVSVEDSNTLFSAVSVEGKTISKIIEDALNIDDSEYVSVSITKKDDVIQTDSEKKFYFSPEYTINVKGVSSYVTKINKIKVTLTGAPDGTKLVDKEGKELDMDDVPSATAFYVRVPADKVTKNTSISVEASVPLDITTAYKYVATGKQTLAALGPKAQTYNTGISFDLTPTGDTGMNVGQTVYFIGLIVLLCGVGIIYANAKPSQAKE